MAKLRIFLVDDHPLLRDGLRALLDAQPDMEVVGEAGDGADLAPRVAASNADVVLMDVKLPGSSGGAKATAELLERSRGLKVLALSAHEERAYVEQMFAAGAAGYVVKRAAPDELAHAIRCVAQGETYVDPLVAGALVHGAPQKRSAAGDSGEAKLSDREAEVLQMIARGLVLKDIAASLSVSLRTVETYRERAMEKAGLRSRADIVRFAVERGWLSST